MDLSNLPSVIASLAGSAVVTFIVLVLVDDLFGVVLAVKDKTFDAHKLPSFLASQFGTREALVLAGLAATAYVTGSDVKTAVLNALTAGGFAMALAVLADIYSKGRAMLTPAAKPAAAA